MLRICPGPSPNNCKWLAECCTMKPQPPHHPRNPFFPSPVSQPLLLLSQLPQHSTLPLASGPSPMLSVPCNTHTTLTEPPPDTALSLDTCPHTYSFPSSQLKGHFLQEPLLTLDEDRYSVVCPQSISPFPSEGMSHLAAISYLSLCSTKIISHVWK